MVQFKNGRPIISSKNDEMCKRTFAEFLREYDPLESKMNKCQKKFYASRLSK